MKKTAIFGTIALFLFLILAQAQDLPPCIWEDSSGNSGPARIYEGDLADIEHAECGAEPGCHKDYHNLKVPRDEATMDACPNCDKWFTPISPDRAMACYWQGYEENQGFELGPWCEPAWYDCMPDCHREQLWADETCEDVTGDDPWNYFMGEAFIDFEGMPQARFYQCILWNGENIKGPECMKSDLCGNGRVDEGEECESNSDCSELNPYCLRCSCNPCPEQTPQYFPARRESGLIDTEEICCKDNDEYAEYSHGEPQRCCEDGEVVHYSFSEPRVDFPFRGVIGDTRKGGDFETTICCGYRVQPEYILGMPNKCCSPEETEIFVGEGEADAFGKYKTILCCKEGEIPRMKTSTIRVIDSGQEVEKTLTFPYDCVQGCPADKPKIFWGRGDYSELGGLSEKTCCTEMTSEIEYKGGIPGRCCEAEETARHSTSVRPLYAQGPPIMDFRQGGDMEVTLCCDTRTLASYSIGKVTGCCGDGKVAYSGSGEAAPGATYQTILCCDEGELALFQKDKTKDVIENGEQVQKKLTYPYDCAEGCPSSEPQVFWGRGDKSNYGSNPKKLCCEGSDVYAEYSSGEPTRCCEEGEVPHYSTAPKIPEYLTRPNWFYTTKGADSEITYCCEFGVGAKYYMGVPKGCCAEGEAAYHGRGETDSNGIYRTSVCCPQGKVPRYKTETFITTEDGILTRVKFDPLVNDPDTPTITLNYPYDCVAACGRHCTRRLGDVTEPYGLLDEWDLRAVKDMALGRIVVDSCADLSDTGTGPEDSCFITALDWAKLKVQLFSVGQDNLVCEPNSVSGDISGDGEVNERDLTTIHSMARGVLTPISSGDKICGDVDGDGDVDLTDVHLTMQIIIEHNS
mgnify:CR=1 FL=1